MSLNINWVLSRYFPVVILSGSKTICFPAVLSSFFSKKPHSSTHFPGSYSTARKANPSVLYVRAVRPQWETTIRASFNQGRSTLMKALNTLGHLKQNRYAFPEVCSFQSTVRIVRIQFLQNTHTGVRNRNSTHQHFDQLCCFKEILLERTMK